MLDREAGYQHQVHTDVAAPRCRAISPNSFWSSSLQASDCASAGNLDIVPCRRCQVWII